MYKYHDASTYERFGDRRDVEDFDTLLMFVVCVDFQERRSLGCLWGKNRICLEKVNNCESQSLTCAVTVGSK